jgi:hypothetical protein
MRDGSIPKQQYSELKAEGDRISNALQKLSVFNQARRTGNQTLAVRLREEISADSGGMFDPIVRASL